MKLNQDEKNRVAIHILPTSANLLGICFLIFTLSRRDQAFDATILDDCASGAVLLFFAASLCSYISIRTGGRGYWETAADLSFFLGLVVLANAAVLVTLAFVA